MIRNLLNRLFGSRAHENAGAPASQDRGDGDQRDRLRERLDALAVPCARIELATDDVPAGPTDSRLGDGPYLPEGSGWPADANGPLSFVAQINLAQAPALPGFPDHGLLQWFTSADDTYGLSFDETQGTTGFVVRWFDDLSAPSVGTPAYGERASELSPVDETGRLVLTAGRSLPAWEELPAEVRAEPLWREVARGLGEPDDGPDLAFVYEEAARGPDSPLADFVVGSKLGGFAGFTQEDPRGAGAYAAAGTPAGRLLVQLDSAETGGWGDAGIAQLFGDPSAVAAGDLGSVRYNWDCS